MNGIISKTAHRILFLFYILIFIYFFKYDTIVKSSAWSFWHSDPDPPSSVLSNNPAVTYAAAQYQGRLF